MGLSWFIAGLAVGAGATVGLTIWSTSTPEGRAWRQQMMAQSDVVADQVSETAGHLAQKAQETVRTVSSQGQQVMQDAKGAAQDVRATARQANDDLRTATNNPSSTTAYSN